MKCIYFTNPNKNSVIFPDSLSPVQVIKVDKSSRQDIVHRSENSIESIN